MSEVNFSENIEEINDEAFYGTNLSKVDFPQGLRSIKSKAFYKSKIKNLNLKCNIEYIGNEAFNTVRSVNLPPTLRTIEADAFDELNTLIVEESSDTLWLGTKIIRNNKITNSVLHNSAADAESRPGLREIFLGTLTSHKVENLILGNRPISARNVKYISGEELYDDSTYGANAYYCQYNNYIYLPSIVNPSITSLTLIDSNANLCDSLNISVEETKSRTKYKVEYGIPHYIVYKDINTFIYNGILNPSKMTEISVLEISNITPPNLTEDFPNSVYLNCVLKVPTGSKNAYINAPFWKNFWTIEEENFNTENLYQFRYVAERIIIDTEEIELYKGEEFSLNTTIWPEDTFDRTVYYTSSDENISTVSEEGLVTGISVGTTTITATCGDVSATCEVTVTEEDGIEYILTDSDSLISVYSLQGFLIMDKCTTDNLRELPKGIYIVVSGEKRYKVVI